jgi:hypothetical protein
MIELFILFCFVLLIFLISNKSNVKIEKQNNKSIEISNIIFPLQNHQNLQKEPINICNTTQSFMSTDINSDLLITRENKQKENTNENNCNVKLDIYRFNGQNLNIDSTITDNIISTSFNQNFGKINDKSLTTQIYGYKQNWIPCPLIISPLYNDKRSINDGNLEDLNKYGGIYYGINNTNKLIIPITLNNWKLEDNILTLYQPYSTTREEMDKLKYFTYNGLIGNIKGYRDKDQKFNIEWIRWRENNNYISYGTIKSLL